ncbi:hypothetical protein MPER_06542, partial [Moniliophthora perniciosa FA553]
QYIRTAIKNGAVFEIPYSGALTAPTNWWASAREVVRVTKGKGVIVSSGAEEIGDLRAPRDIANLVSLLGLPQDASHAALTKEPKSLVLRAQTRKTYRAVLSEPTVVIPEGWQPQATTAQEPISTPDPTSSTGKKRPREEDTSMPKDAQSQITGEKKKKKRKKDKGGTGGTVTPS